MIVSDNGPAYKSDRFETFIQSRAGLAHVRTKHHSPETNGVIERFFESAKYKHLYRHEIPNGHALGEELELYRSLSTRSGRARASPSDAARGPTWRRRSPTYSRVKVSKKLDSGHLC